MTADNSEKYKEATIALNEMLANEAVSKELNIIKSGNLGKFYKHVNDWLNHKTGIAPLTNIDGSFCLSDYDKAEVFSVYFSGVGCVDDGKIQTNIDDFVINENSVVIISPDDNDNDRDKSLYPTGSLSTIPRLSVIYCSTYTPSSMLFLALMFMLQPVQIIYLLSFSKNLPLFTFSAFYFV
jgi:hypothetical protein